MPWTDCAEAGRRCAGWPAEMSFVPKMPPGMEDALYMFGACEARTCLGWAGRAAAAAGRSSVHGTARRGRSAGLHCTGR
eukprot:6152-Pleurochrysis_carterae.AAC.2